MNSSRDSAETALLGVRLDLFSSRPSVRATCERFLDEDRTHCVFTPNPEILLYAGKHPDYQALLNEADLALPDGIGVVLVHLLQHRRFVRRWAGIDVAQMVLAIAAERHAPAMFIGGYGGVAEAAADRFRRRLPRLEVTTVANDVPFGEDGMPVHARDEADLATLIEKSRPAVILVALGHPKQERWIARHREVIPSARIMMGVGGALDVWGGRFPRAPRWLRSAGLEWLWRLWNEPVRLPRTLRATIEFPLRALVERRG